MKRLYIIEAKQYQEGFTTKYTDSAKVEYLGDGVVQLSNEYEDGESIYKLALSELKLLCKEIEKWENEDDQ